MARLIRTEKEVEGRFEEVWLVVEEDPLEQWPAGPLTVVGRGAVRQDALERVRGEARYTADIQLPGMLHTAVLRSPYAHARVKTIDLAPALALPGVHAAIGPDEAKGLEERARLLRRGGGCRRGRHVRAGPARRRGDRRRMGAARGGARPERGGASASSSRRRRPPTSAATSPRRSRPPTS